jgi:hypothetical protein
VVRDWVIRVQDPHHPDFDLVPPEVVRHVLPHRLEQGIGEQVGDVFLAVCMDFFRRGFFGSGCPG